MRARGRGFVTIRFGTPRFRMVSLSFGRASFDPHPQTSIVPVHFVERRIPKPLYSFIVWYVLARVKSSFPYYITTFASLLSHNIRHPITLNKVENNLQKVNRPVKRDDARIAVFRGNVILAILIFTGGLSLSGNA